MKDLLAWRIKQGDEQAFELLFHKFYIRLCGFANKFLNNPDESHEVVQEAFARLWEDRSEIDADGNLKAYLFRIVENMSLNSLQHKKVESKYIEIYKLVYVDHREFSPQDSLMARELDASINLAIGKLPAECRKVFEMSRVKGLKYKEIADTLNISVKTVEAQMSKALRQLRFELGEYLLLP
jgi:RNA polymerase sigma-70 factor, ECF subfamily